MSMSPIHVRIAALTRWAISMAVREPITVEGVVTPPMLDANRPPSAYYTLRTGVINKIEAESGSGLTFNVYFADGYTAFVRFSA